MVLWIPQTLISEFTKVDENAAKPDKNLRMQSFAENVFLDEHLSLRF